MKKKLLVIINNIYNWISHPYTVVIMAIGIALWLILGIPLHFNDLWYKSLYIFELLATLILVFIIEVTQKSEMKAMQEKLDEIIKKIPEADNKKAEIEKKYKGERK